MIFLNQYMCWIAWKTIQNWLIIFFNLLFTTIINLVTILHLLLVLFSTCAWSPNISAWKAQIRLFSLHLIMKAFVKWYITFPAITLFISPRLDASSSPTHFTFIRWRLPHNFIYGSVWLLSSVYVLISLSRTSVKFSEYWGTPEF